MKGKGPWLKYKIAWHKGRKKIQSISSTLRRSIFCTNGSNVLGYSCIIDRSDQKVLIKDKIISQIKFKIDTFKSDNLPDKLKKIAPIKPGSRSLSK